MIKLVELTKIYNSGESVGIGIQNINLELHLGEFVGIVGTSGSGKTTLLNIISGMDTYSEGEMFIDGKSTANFDSEELENYRRANVAFIFQNYQLIDAYTAFENVYVELLIKGLDKKEAKAKTLELLEKVGMLKSKNTRASKLSGGEKQRIVIARALASDAKIRKRTNFARFSIFVQMFLCESITPFETPVVPEVNIKDASASISIESSE